MAGKVTYKIIKKAKTGDKIAPTLRLQHVAEMVEKGGITSKAKILAKAKYSKTVQNNPSKVFDNPFIRKTVDEVIKKHEKIRDKALQALENKKLNKESVMSLNMLLRNLNHDIELLAGRPTERTDEGLDPEEKKKLQGILAQTRNQ